VTALNQWERHVIEAEIAREDVIGWLRNIERKPWALAIPYEWGGAMKPMYPDFLVVRRQTAGLVVDILEPHMPALADS
jgi:type III restriction enzyme